MNKYLRILLFLIVIIGTPYLIFFHGASNRSWWIALFIIWGLSSTSEE